MNSQDHKEYVQEIFDKAASHYGEKACSFFDYFGERLVAFANPTKGEQVLDIATGKGAVLFPAAKAVGASGSVKGIDLSLKMVEETRKRISSSQIEVSQMDAEHLAFPDNSFDLVFCAFALFFFPNPQQALSEMKRVLKPKGRLAVSIWGKKPTLDAWVAEKANALGASRKLGTLSLNNAEDLERLLSRGGFTSIIKEESKTFHFETAEEWFDSLWTHGTRAQLEQLSPQNLEILRKEALIKARQLPTVSQARPVIYGLTSAFHI